MSPVALFIIGLLIFVFGFGSFIAFMAVRFSGNIARRIYIPLERLIILGITLGILAMFQPWWAGLFQPGFLLLLLSTLAYMVWSHVTPKSEDIEEKEAQLTIY